jgi:hypothetical protein
LDPNRRESPSGTTLAQPCEKPGSAVGTAIASTVIGDDTPGRSTLVYTIIVDEPQWCSMALLTWRRNLCHHTVSSEDPSHRSASTSYLSHCSSPSEDPSHRSASTSYLGKRSSATIINQPLRNEPAGESDPNRRESLTSGTTLAQPCEKPGSAVGTAIASTVIGDDALGSSTVVNPRR